MSNVMARMAQIQRERRTEEIVRAMDADDIVQLIHSLEDKMDEMDDERTELLDELEDMVCLAESAMRHANRDGCEYDVSGELEAPRAAIAKAKGES